MFVLAVGFDTEKERQKAKEVGCTRLDVNILEFLTQVVN